MISVENAKEYLRIPAEQTDEDAFVNSIIQDGYDYLRDAVDDFDEIYAENEVFARKADRYVLHFHLPTAYDEREGLGAGAECMSYSARALMTQLSLYRKAGDNNAN